eukprot:1340458-Amphidinium_carterae.1
MKQGQGVIVTDCKGAAVVANKLQSGFRRPRGRHSRIEHRILASIGDIHVQWMPSDLTAQQAAEAAPPAAYVSGNAEADLLAGQAVQEVPGLLPLLHLFRKAEAAARTFWSLFPAACSPLHRVQEDLDPARRRPERGVAELFPSQAKGASPPARETFLHQHLGVVREQTEAQDLPSCLAPPMNLWSGSIELMIIWATVCPSTIMSSCQQGLYAVNKVFMIGTHPCIITEGGIRMACRNYKRYVSTYQWKWRN